MPVKINKLNIEATATGINLDIDGAPEGIHIEYKILPNVVAAVMRESSMKILGATDTSEWPELPGGKKDRSSLPGAEEEKALLLTHLFGMKIRGSATADICDAAAELVRFLPPGSLQLADDAEQALQGHVDHLGIRFIRSDHAIDRVNELARDKPIFRDVMTQFLHD